MGWLGLARRSAARKPLRMVLLMVCVAVSFLIYGLTGSFQHGGQGAAGASDDILGVMSAAGRGQSLPMAYLPRLEAEPGVAEVGFMTRMRGFVGVETNVVAVSAADPGRLSRVNGQELGLTPELLAGLSEARDHVLVGRALAEAQGWSIGQSITVTAFDVATKDGSRDWRFQVAGIFDGADASTDTYFVIARYDYVNAMRARGTDMVDAFILRPAAGVSPGTLARNIDTLFANSAMPTRTQSEKQFLEAFLRQFADIGLIVSLVVGAAFVTLLMIVINTLTLAVRERRFEIGVLKTLGFSPRHILALILGETLFIFVIGGGTGLLLAKLATLFTGAILGLVLSGQIIGEAVLLILGLGLASGLIPAIGAMRIPVTAAFSTR